MCYSDWTLDEMLHWIQKHINTNSRLGKRVDGIILSNSHLVHINYNILHFQSRLNHRNIRKAISFSIYLGTTFFFSQIPLNCVMTIYKIKILHFKLGKSLCTKKGKVFFDLLVACNWSPVSSLSPPKKTNKKKKKNKKLKN